MTASKRTAALQNCCIKCGTSKNLTLHHIVPVRWGGSSKVWNLATLCKPCHIRFETALMQMERAVVFDAWFKFLQGKHKGIIRRTWRQIW